VVDSVVDGVVDGVVDLVVGAVVDGVVDAVVDAVVEAVVAGAGVVVDAGLFDAGTAFNLISAVICLSSFEISKEYL